MNLRGGAVCLAAVLMTAACDDGSKPDKLAPEAAELKVEQSAPAGAQSFAVDSSSSSVTFVMEAPVEKTYGDAPKSMTGSLSLDLDDLTKSSGLLKVDLMDLTLSQQKRAEGEAEFGERTTSDTQNQHMRTWFEISEDAPEEVRQKNRYVEFKLLKVSNASEKNINAMSGAERKITAEVSGDFRLHGRKTSQTVKIEAIFEYADGKPKQVRIRTLEPLTVGLAEHDVRPREAFGKLAQKTLSALGQKVAGEAPVMLEFTASLER